MQHSHLTQIWKKEEEIVKHPNISASLRISWSDEPSYYMITRGSHKIALSLRLPLYVLKQFFTDFLNLFQCI